jgi:hypothetical protein
MTATARTVIAPIVEGHGEVQAVPILIRRICHEILDRYDVVVRKPWKLPRSKVVKPPELFRAVQATSQSVGSTGGVLVLLDLDDDGCAIQLAKSLAVENVQCRIEIVVAVREYEAWFLAAVSSLRSHKSMSDDAHFLDDPEAPRDAKGRLEMRMLEKYRETLHQASFTDLLDLDMACAASRSLRHMVSAVQRLIDTD